jgi:hypothetical protein
LALPWLPTSLLRLLPPFACLLLSRLPSLLPFRQLLLQVLQSRPLRSQTQQEAHRLLLRPASHLIDLVARHERLRRGSQRAPRRRAAGRRRRGRGHELRRGGLEEGCGAGRGVD